MWKPTGQLTNKSKVVSGPKPNLLKGGCTQKKNHLDVEVWWLALENYDHTGDHRIIDN